MYRSPIDIIYSDLNMKLENEVYKAIQNVCISVDKDELIKALAYDRQQYEQGYADAKAEEQLTLAHPEPKMVFDKLQPQFNLYYLCPNQPKQKRGNWKNGYCSECGYYWGKDAPFENVPNFCPNCGTQMKERLKDE